MEYVGSGTNYSALPENGGVPDETKQIKEDNYGKVWAVTVDHKGKLKAGEDFAVDQETGAVLLGTGALAIPTLITNLDTNGKTISDSQGDIQIGTDVSMGLNKIRGLATPAAGDSGATAANKTYADTKVETVTVTAPITESTTTTNGIKTVALDINDATTAAAGVVQLYDDVDSTSTTQAGTANAVKFAYDRGNTGVVQAALKLPMDGSGSMSGDLNLDSGVNITFDGGGANGEISGITDTTNTTSSTVVASATAVKAAYDLADDALPQDGTGQMTGALDMNNNNIDNVQDMGIAGNVIIAGNLNVTGTTTTVNSQNLLIEDKNIELAVPPETVTAFTANTTANSNQLTILTNALTAPATGQGIVIEGPAGCFSPNTNRAIVTIKSGNTITTSLDASSNLSGATFTPVGLSNTNLDGGGITLKGTVDKTFTYTPVGGVGGRWESSEDILVESGHGYYVKGGSGGTLIREVLNYDTLGSTVINSSLETVATITAGTWNGTTIGVDYGGTGQTSYTDGQLLIGNSNGNTLSKATLTGGNGVTVTNGNGSINLDVDLKANGGLVIESTELALDLDATSITGTLGIGDGGTGISTAPSQTQVLVGNSNSGYDLRTVVAGTNTTVDTSTAGQIAINATDTTYTAGDGLTLSSTEFSVNLNGSNSGLEFIGGKLQADDSIARATGDTFTGACTFNETLFLGQNTSNILSTLAFKELSGSNYVGFKAPNAIATDIVWTLPDADGGKAGDVLTTNASGTLSWGRVLAGGGTDRVFFENDTTINTVYTITAGKNAMSAGPITVQPGATPIVPSGSTWTIV
jgi:hypothetical protein